jgi:hypothetical protein
MLQQEWLLKKLVIAHLLQQLLSELREAQC